MKKILPVIIGILLGIAMSATLIVTNHSRTAYGAENFWNKIVAYGDFFNWQDIFAGSDTPHDIYLLVYKKLLEMPQKDALTETATKYGLTKAEAQAVVDGSVAPIFNNPARHSAQLTNEQALQIADRAQKDFKDFKDTFDMRNQVDVLIKPSELFSNGDIYDSGFDLIHDLSVMEEILFVEKKQNTVGKPFGGQLSSPILPTQPLNEAAPYVNSNNPAAILRQDLDSNSGTGQGAAQGADSGQISFSIGDTKVNAEILKDDLCPKENDLSKQVSEFDSNKVEIENTALAPTTTGTSPEVVAGLGGEEITTDTGETIQLAPAPADEWLQSWCPALTGESGDAAAANTFGQAGFDSLSNTVSSLVNQSMGAAAAYSSERLSAKISICLDIQRVGKSVSSYYPGESCILCEISKINALLDKTLSHSLVPNKVTGNLFESAKCKKAYGEFLNMQIVTIPAPVPTPSKDDVVYGKNIFEEWKKFLTRYQPILYPDVGGITDFQTSVAAPDTTQNDVLNSVNSALAQQAALATRSIESTASANTATNMNLFSQSSMAAIKQMHAFFNSYLDLFKKINTDLCPAIIQKPDI